MRRRATQPDPLTKQQRRLNMSRIRNRDTKPEFVVRTGLHRLGFRYRLHDKRLIGKPDIVLPRFRTVVFVHGCFWHGHECDLGVIPRSNSAFWHKKISLNQERDRRVTRQLIEEGWKIAIVWECALRGPRRLPIDELLSKLANFIRLSSKAELFEVIGRTSPS